jgi:N utilization substance protein A
MENLALIESFSEFKDDKLIDRVTLMAILEDVFRNALKKKLDRITLISSSNPDKGDMEIWRRSVIVADDDLDHRERRNYANRSQ